MSAIAATPGAARLFASSILGRVPLAMLSIALLVHAEHLTGSFAAAGMVTAAYAVALGVVGPVLGRLVDRRGQTAVLLASALASATLLVAVALTPAGAPLMLLVALALGIGAATPPLGACLRTLLGAVLPDAGAVRAAYAVEATASELAWVSGPPLALGIGALWSTGAALVVAGIVLLGGTVAFSLQPASRAWRPAAGGERPRGGSLRTPAMRTLVTVLVGVGVLFGGVEVAVAAASEALGSSAAAGPLLALWGAGSLLGGFVAVRLGGADLALLLGVLAAGHLALVPAAGSVVALGAVLLVAGAAIAPTYATVYAMVDHAAPAGTVTEAFAWLATAIAIGASAGAAGAGALADHAGPGAAFALAGVAGRDRPARRARPLPHAAGRARAGPRLSAARRLRRMDEEAWPARVELPLRHRDMDALGHVNQAVYHELLEEVRTAFMSRALPALPPTGWVLVRTELDYRSEVRISDRRLTGECRVAELGRSRIELENRLLKPDGTVAAEGRAVVVTWDEETRRARTLTDDERAALLDHGPARA